MGQPGAKKGDQIVSATPGDVHIIMIPSPGGPVPTPIPHPCASIINDKVAEKVKVMGQPGAVKGSTSKHTPPHIPMGPGPFQKPPANKGEIVTASANVFYEGKEAAMMGDTAKMCSDPSDTPVGKVIGTAAMVLVGGGGSGSDEAREAAAVAAMKAASAACHRWINANMPPGAHREQAHRDVCKATGHPVDVATGKMFTRSVDLQLIGRMRFAFVRNYSSARSDRGAFGRSWRHTYESWLVVHPEFVAHRDENGRFLSFEPPSSGAIATNEVARVDLRRDGETYRFKGRDGLIQVFSGPGERRGDALVLPLREVRDTFGNRILFEHVEGRLARIVESAGRTIHLSYDERGFVRSLALSLQPGQRVPDTVRTYSYSDEGDLIEVRDADGHSIRYEYSGGFLVKETDRTGFSFYFVYDAEGWCRATWGDGGLLLRWIEYDRERGRTRVTDSLGWVTTFRWSPQGVVVEERSHSGAAWTFEYDGSFHQVRVVDPLANAWSYAYDEQGRLIAGEDPEGLTFEFAYGPDGRPQRYVDAAGLEWKWNFLDAQRARRSVDPAGNARIQVQDAKGDLEVVYEPDGSATRMRYNDQGLPVVIEHADGLVIRRTYSVTGELLTEEDGFGERLRLEYDRLRRPRSVWKRGGGLAVHERDGEGRLIKLTRDDGTVTEYRYAHLNRIERVVYPEVDLADGTRHRPTRIYEYDTEGRVTKLTLPGGAAVHYEYDSALPQPTAVRYADGRVHRVERNARGFVRRLEENGVLVYENETDSAGRVVRRITGDGDEETFEYDPYGRLAVAVNGVGRAEIVRDTLGRIVSEEGPEGAIRRTYGEQGALRTEGLEGGIELQLVGGSIPGRLRWRQQGGSGGVELTYDRLTRLIRADFDHGVVLEALFEDGAVPRVQRARNGTGRLVREEREQLDTAGRVTATEHDGRGTVHYTRDQLGRLREAVTRRGDIARLAVWGFDRDGNRVVQSDDGGEQFRCSYGPGHRPQVFGDTRLVYDERGRVVRREGSGGFRAEYVWDSMGHLLEVRDAHGAIATMRYDALGRRVSKTTAEGTTSFVWAGDRMVHERRPDGEARHYLYHSDSFRPLMLLRQPEPDAAWETYAFVTDARGCPTALLGHDAEVVWSADVSPFGLTRVDSASRFDQPLGMPGQYRDAETGLSYNRHRYYLPEIGAYLSPDPLGVAAADSVYAYVDDPMTWFDPLGLGPDDYTPEQRALVQACGDPRAAKPRDGEFDMTPELGPIRVAQPGQPMQLDPNESGTYLYVVGEDGRIYYAPLDKTFAHLGIEDVKHTTLAGPDPANSGMTRPMRVGGEITHDPDRGVWIMDGKSGRFSSDGTNTTRTPDNVHAANSLNDSFATPANPGSNIDTADKPFW